ncbi:tyrosine-type recombinase/integrase [Corynebacterium sp. H127]|uniref:tyrosine-type recombinase/integrase n=1 Tax=Corynebacterium sp. H127 TaxID=3133418 RepID=UPI00309C9E55
MAKKTDEQIRSEWTRKGTFGTVRLLQSGRFQAFFRKDGVTHKAPRTFAFDYVDARRRNGDGAREAENWINDQIDTIHAAELSGTKWIAPTDKAKAQMTVKELVEDWLSKSTAIKKESTRQSHRRKLDTRVLRDSFPGFDSLANIPVVDVDRNRIRVWWSQVQEQWPDEGNTNAYAYKRLKTAFGHAVNELEIITTNPVNIKGAGTPPRSDNKDKELLTLAEAAAMVEQAHKKLKAPLVVLQWCGLRLGELLELRRKDFIDNGDTLTIRVRRNVQRIKDEVTGKQVLLVMDTPKTDAGNRDIVVPASKAAVVRAHLKTYVGKRQNDLFITKEDGSQMKDTEFRKDFAPVKEAAGRPDITPHDLRRFFGTMLVNHSGISLEEARRIMGHEKIEQLMEYQRASANYEHKAAANLDKFITEEEA